MPCPGPLIDPKIAAVRRRWTETRAANQRLAVLLSGDADWTSGGVQRLVAAIPELSPTWLTERPLAPVTRSPRAASQLLGQDLDLLVYDAHGGFDPDGFGAASGTLRGGGILILLTPSLADWPSQTDPEAERIAVWPHSAASVSGRFIARLVRTLLAEPALIRIAQTDPGEPDRSGGAESPCLVNGSMPPRRLDLAATPDQEAAVAAILKTARGRARRPLVLTAHRGRGKSGALGLAAGQLLLAGHRRILLTAPRKASVDALYRHAAAVLQARRSHAHGDIDITRELPFQAPDALLIERPTADLLLVDEAAGIPAPLLAALLQHYPRIVFATSVHGYEGTGRGFEVRFRETLDHITPNWRGVALETPIRWASGDPLERLTFRALLLDASPAADDRMTTATAATCVGERLDPERLGSDEDSLRELFGLLVLAHYQTRPMDLRMLLDGPNVRIYALRRGPHIAAALVVAEEGGFEDPDLRSAIYRGQRRPRGHLLPQTLSAHAGLLDAPGFRYLRVVRIAVHPAAKRRGLGRMLLRLLERDALAEGFDLIGASFGATPDLLRFWDRCGHHLAQIGTHPNAASGELAVAMLEPTSNPGARFLVHARERFESRFPVLLAGPLRDLDPALAAGLLRAAWTSQATPKGTETPEDRMELRAFATGYRTLEASLPLLSAFARTQLAPSLFAGAITLQEAALMTAAALQFRPMAELVRLFEATGRAEILQRLRNAARRIAPT